MTTLQLVLVDAKAKTTEDGRRYLEIKLECGSSTHYLAFPTVIGPLPGLLVGCVHGLGELSLPESGDCQHVWVSGHLVVVSHFRGVLSETPVVVAHSSDALRGAVRSAWEISIRPQHLQAEPV